MSRTITVLTGPPCSGKSTYIDERRERDDVVVDLDRIAHALGYPTEQMAPADKGAQRQLARAARTAVLKAALNWSTQRNGGGLKIWIIDSRPQPWQLVDYRRRSATVIELNPGRDECIRRAKQDSRPAGTIEMIEAWYGPDESVKVKGSAQRWAL